MIWVMRLVGLALGAVGFDAIGFLVYQRVGAALDLPGCAAPSWQSIVVLDSGALVAFSAAGLLLLSRPRFATAADTGLKSGKQLAK